ncbi:MAG: tetratricopeptide repeat protein [Deltaproteobacteria bacterium]|nr:tetratricopeptide repeat protein [Deltaproteobacteria bacterium]MBW2658981.1 tetratricopeptide repeat protein [Deltaproteobacteria bacterium]
MSTSFHNNIEDIFAEACELHSRLNFATAEKIYLELLEKNPGGGLIHYNIGLLYYQTEQFNKAIAHYMKAKKLAPADPDLLFNLALCQKQLGRLHDAAAGFEELIQISPKELDALYNLGNCYRELREYAKAEQAYLRLLLENPDHLSANRNLAYLYHLQKDFDSALKYYNKVLALEEGDPQAVHMVAAITDSGAASAPAEYIRDIFNRYSETFDEVLPGNLKYVVPEKLRSRLDSLGYPLSLFPKCIDLGCGTGLAGSQFGPVCNHLTGVDLSEKMIEKASAKGIYDILQVSEITSFLETKSDEYDLAVAADVLTYMGDLAPLFRALTEAMGEQALFCCSTEDSDQPAFSLCPNGRFTHSPAYVLKTAARFGWQCIDQTGSRLREEESNPVTGTLYFFTKKED